MSFKNYVFEQSDGKIDFEANGAESNSAQIANAAVQYATQGARTEENAVYDTKRRVERAAAVMSLVSSNYEDKQTLHAYRSIDFNNYKNGTAETFSTGEWMDRIGLGHAAENKASNMAGQINFSSEYRALGKNFSLDTNALNTLAQEGTYSFSSGGINTTISLDKNGIKTLTDASDKNSALASLQLQVTENMKGQCLGNFTSSELSMMEKGGSFIRNGRTYRMNSVDTAKLGSAVRSANEETERRYSVQGKTRESLQKDAMTSIHQRSLNYVQARGGALENIGKGKNINSDIGVARQELSRQIAKLQKAGGADAQIAKLKEDQKILASFDKIGKQSGQGGMSHQQKYGMRIIAGKVVGDDMMQGAQFYKRAAKITQTAVKLGYRAGLSATSAVFSNRLVKNAMPNFSKIGDGAAQLKKRSKENERAKKNGTYKDLKRSREAAQKERRAQKRDARNLRRDNQISSLKAKGNNATKKEERRLHNLERKRNRQERFNRVSAKINSARNKLRDAKDSILAPLGKIKNLFEALSSPIDFVKMLLAKAAKAISAFIVSTIFVPIVFVLLCSILFIMFIYILFFVSELPSAEEALNNSANYVQIIVDSTANDLGDPLLDTLAADAETHFLTGNLVPSEWTKAENGDIKEIKYNWYMDSNNGQVNNFYASEENNLPVSEKTELMGINDNLVPIVSMMHCRYYDDIDFEHWPTAKAYVYYMYAMSHNVLRDENGNVIYQYEKEIPCENAMLYGSTAEDGSKTATTGVGNSVKNSYDVATGTVIRPENELCSNIYIHGYDKSLAANANKKKASLTSLLKKGLNALGGILNSSADRRVTTGVVKATDTSNPIKDTIDGVDYYCDNYVTVHGGLDCGKVEHTHNIKNVCTKSGDCNAKVGEPGYHICNSVPVCQKSNCPGYEHTHDHTGYYVNDNTKCDEKIYICLGHCGGHVTPIIDVTETMTYEELVKLDCFKTTRKLASAEVGQDILTEITGFRSYDDWLEYWMKKANKWFKPYSSSLFSQYEKNIRQNLMLAAKAIDWVTNLFSGGTENAGTLDVDLFGFQSWYVVDANGNTTGVLNEDQINTLEAIYGTWKDESGELKNYDVGIEAWEDFEVVFPIGGKSLTQKQKTQILQYLEKEKGISSGSPRYKVIEEGLDCCGKFSYSLTGDAHMNGLNNRSGRSDCSGFICGILNRSLGTSYNYAAANFPKKGSVTEGSIRFKIGGGVGKNGETYTGHVVLYVGELPSDIGPEGAGKYVIDCSSSAGGSSLRKMSDSELSAYSNIFNYWE